MVRRRLMVLPVAALLGGAAVALAGPPVPPTTASTVPGPAEWHAATWKTFDAAGVAHGTSKWHWTTAGGNCCEVYVSATKTGRLLEYGGTWPWYSDDTGKTWTRIVPVTPLRSGEGAIVAGPRGNIYGIGWDPYSGDHLQGLRYTNSTKTWEVAEAPIKTPVFDREWITYVKGPFLDELGAKVPFITLVRGGTATKQLALIATDGISYTTATDPNLDVTQGGEPRFFQIRTPKNPDADWWQPNPGTFTLPLNGGGVLLMNNGEDDLKADAAWLNPDTLKWERVRLAFKPTGTVRQDSRGWLTMVTQHAGEFDLGLSKNGGKSWKHTVLTLPESQNKPEASSGWYDVKVNGKLGQAVVVTRADDRKGNGQDLVWRVDIGKAQPKVLKAYAIGKGDLNTTIGVAGSLSNRFDFPSIALLPNGKIAVSFDDSTTPLWTSADGLPTSGSITNPTGHSPALAILD